MNQLDLQNSTAADLEKQSKPAPGRKTAENPVWICVADGIWLNTRAKQRWLYERPVINYRQTFKALGTTKLQDAKRELAKRITLRFQGQEPTEKKQERALTCGDVIRAYQDAAELVSRNTSNNASFP